MKPDRGRGTGAAEAALAAERSETTGSSLLERLLAPRDKGAGPLEALTGHLAGIDDEGRLLFQPDGAGGEPIPVTIGLDLGDGPLVRAARQQQRALVLRTAGPRPGALLVALLRERVSAQAREAEPGRLEVSLDGEKLRLEAETEIELRCGKSSLLLRRDGRVVLSGVYVLTKSRGPVKLKGATIALN